MRYGNDYEKCPKCNNRNLKIYEQLAMSRVVSARTGKVLAKEQYLETTCWNYLCKCGWHSELSTP